MAIAYIHEFEVGADRSTTIYDSMGEHMRMEQDPPAGLVMHSAGFCGSKFQMFEVWESAEAQEHFERERLMPALREVAGDGGTPPSIESYELHNLLAP
jgi:hypothetical protein